MFKKIGTLFLLSLLTMNLHAASYNIFQVFSIDIPKEFEVNSVGSDIRYNKKINQYWLNCDISIIYRNEYFTINFQMFGNGEASEVKNKFSFNAITKEYWNKYNSALNEAIINSKGTSVRNSDFSITEFISDWASDYSSDVFAYRFNPNISGVEVCIVKTINSWYSFGTKQILGSPELNFQNKLKYEEMDTQNFYTLYRRMIESISKSKNNSIIVNSTYHLEPDVPTTILFPSIKDLRLRETETLNGRVLGYVQYQPYSIIQIGREETIDGIVGKWLRIKGNSGSKIGWAFGGYLHTATKNELDNYYKE